MPDFSTLAVFAVACLALASVPGPDMLFIAPGSAIQGRASGLLNVQMRVLARNLNLIAGFVSRRLKFQRMPQYLLGTVFAGLVFEKSR